MLTCLAAGACGEATPPAERVAAFCDTVREGQRIEAVRTRYEDYALQPGGVAPDPGGQLENRVDGDAMPTVSGVLVEPSGAPAEDPRPVCAVYYSSAVLGGDGRVILAQYLDEWRDRY